ncbi:MAG: CapA family protein [Bacteroidia bacterium]|nr:CapA family protein [Bacteroidia bacterium]
MERKSEQAGISSMDKNICNQSYCFRNGRYWLLIILTYIFLVSCNNEKSEIRVLFVGDILLSRNVKEEYKSRNIFPWEDLKQTLHSADLVFGNLEGAVGNFHDQINPSAESPVFAIDSCDISMLYKAGFNAITIENNHIFDLGLDGKNNTISSLLNNNIKPICFENSPHFITVKNVVFSFIAVNTILNRDSTKSQIPSVEVSQKLRLAKSLSNIVIVSIHWGSELLEWPSNEQRDAAKWLVSHGADIIIGSHPHVIQNPEVIEGKPVFFSLGNHLFDQKYPKTKEGLIAEIIIKKGKFQCAGHKTRTKKNSFFPELHECLDYKFKPIKYKRELLTVNNITLKPLSLIDDRENKTVLQAFNSGEMIWNSHPMPLISLSSNNLDGKDAYLFALEKYYSNIDKEINIRIYVYNVDNKGIYAKWRGSALAWPLLDAEISLYDDRILCALHRGDSYIMLDKTKMNKRIAAYKWNGFGFKGLSDSIACKYCKDVFE